MIGSLRGNVVDRIRPGELLVDVNGVGYRAIVPPSTFVALGDPGAAVFLHTHLHVREDALTLYGFATREERSCFEALLGAHGVGPALALAILSVHGPRELGRLLAEDDVAALCLVPGVGKKTAARLLLDLKSRLHVPDLDLAEPAGGNGAGMASGGRSDVRDALAQLGYGPDEVREAMRDLPLEGDTQLLLKQALKRLAAVR